MANSCAWGALSLWLLTGCGDGVTCPQGVFAAISVHALSAADATPILNVRGGVRDGTFTDTLVELGQGFYDAAPGRPGTYGVHVEHANYAAWDTSGVVVHTSGGPCPLIETAELEARLASVE